MKFVLLLSLFGAAHLNAAALALNVLNPDRTASPAQQLEFTGTILNQTPVALDRHRPVRQHFRLRSVRSFV